MKMIWTDDPLAAYERYVAEQEAALQILPVFSICDKHIQDDYCYNINDEIICEKCMVEQFRHDTTDFMG